MPEHPGQIGLKPGDRFHRDCVITAEAHRAFTEVFADRNPLHTDEGFARARGFQGLVMHGNILNGFLSALIGESLPLKNVIIHNQEIRFMQPTYLNDALALEAEVTDVHEAVGAVEFKFRFLRAGAAVARGRFQIGVLP